MQKLIYLITRASRYLISVLFLQYSNAFTKWKFYSNNIKFNDIRSNGVPFVMIANGGKATIGKGFRINNGLRGNPIGRPQKCVFFVDRGATLVIGDNVGISATAIVASTKIVIGDNVKIGGGVCIYDTDFHSLNSKERQNAASDKNNKINKPVQIKNNVFIGAHTTILKGVTIGENAIVGACSVVTKDIPANEIWAGNPAKKIKSNLIKG